MKHGRREERGDMMAKADRKGRMGKENAWLSHLITKNTRKLQKIGGVNV